MENYTKRDGDSALSDNCRQPPFKKPMNNNPAGNHLLACCAGSAISALLAFSSPAAEAGIHLHGEIRVPAAGQAVFLYDPSGFPIWGYSPCGRPIYAYTPAGAPIYVIRDIYRGCHVPAWNPRPHYHGPFWPAGVCRGHHAARLTPCPPPFRPHRPRRPHEGPLPVSTAGKTHPHPPQSKRPSQSFLFIPGKKGRTSLPPAA